MFDVHTHLHFEAFQNDLHEVIGRTIDADVGGVIVADYDSTRRGDAMELGLRYPGIWCTLGLHPWAVIDAAEAGTLERELTMLMEAVGSSPSGLCGIGECGLDGHYRGGIHHEEQVQTFRKLLKLAQDLDLPMVVHSVKRNEDILKILREDGPPEAGGIIHGFHGSIQQARRFVEFGFDISIGLALACGRRKLEKVVQALDRAHLVVETDCPGRAPDDSDRNRLEPRDLAAVIARISEIWRVSTEEVARITAANARRRFSLSDTLLSYPPTQEVVG